jgi:hypothetical protein
MVCISASRNLISFADFVVFLNAAGNPLFLFGFRNTVSKPGSKFCGQGTEVFVLRIVGILHVQTFNSRAAIYHIFI